MAFSGALTLADLNDFITPSQACIKPVEQVKSEEEVAEPGAAATEIRVDSSGSYYEVAAPFAARKSAQPTASRRLKTAQISLNDCLACSGCITSAESVLITMQSHEEVLSFLSSNPPPDSGAHRLPVLSISPQSLASLAASVSSTSRQPVSLQAILRRVQAFCRQELGFAYIFDTTFARHLSLLEHGREFDERRLARSHGENTLPMLASACPGWVCYAEKAHAEMLPFISRTRSPQQIMGTLVKQWMAKKWDQTPDQIYHVSVMPCYDKKLEASRQDFYNEVYQTRDIDCVITTGELELLMREKAWDLSVNVDGEDTPPLYPITDTLTLPELVSHPGTSSGSYLHSLISLISASPMNRDRDLKLNTRTIRSADYEEYTLEDVVTGEIVFKGAKCYGFRNLQNVVRKVGKENGVRGLPGGAVRGRARRKIEGQGAQDRGYDYVEVMACPSGCVNGGGQIRPSRKVLEDRTQDAEGYQLQLNEGAQVNESEPGSSSIIDAASKWGNKDLIHKVEAAYWSSSAEDQSLSGFQSNGDADAVAARVLQDMCLSTPSPGQFSGVNEKDSACPLKSKSTSMLNHPWMHSLDAQGETKRKDLFRTTYRKVESEVVGLAVKW
ncbi:iron hydrogenase [Ramaria rubella]|nr:iron hydrogenase [Ramaria rubella]